MPCSRSPTTVRHPAYPARPKVIDTARFADPGASDLSAYDCVFLCDVPRLSEREVARLETHLQRGGGLVICLGPRRRFGVVQPAAVQGRQGIAAGQARSASTQAPADGFFTPYADEEAFQRPPLTAFAGDDERASLLAARFKQYVRVEMPPGSAARRVLGLVPTFRRPAQGKPPGPRRPGRPADPRMAAAPWPGRARHQHGQHRLDELADRPELPAVRAGTVPLRRPPAAAADARRSAKPIEELLPPSVLATEATVQTPDGRTETVPLRAEPNATRFRFAETDQSGLYRVSVGSRRGGEAGVRRQRPADRPDRRRERFAATQRRRIDRR